MKCTYCGEELCEDEADDPHRDSDGDPMCYGCYRDHCTFECCLCGEDEDIRYQHVLLVVTAELGDDRVSAGLYQIVRFPYYADGMIEGSLYPWALKRIGDVPEGVTMDDYPCGHLCRECQEKVRPQRRCQVFAGAGG